MVHVAVATLFEPAKTGLDVVHAIAPAEPLTVKATVPLGVAPLLGPVTVAVNSTLLPSAVRVLFVTTLVGVALTTVSVLLLDVTLTYVPVLGETSLTMYEPAFDAVIVQVAVAALADPDKVVLDVVHAIAPADPVTVKATVPLGVAPLLGPVTVAVNSTLLS